MRTPGEQILFAVVFQSVISGGICAYSVWEEGNVVLQCAAGSSKTTFKKWCKINENLYCAPVIHIGPQTTDVFPPWTSADVELVEGSSLRITSVSYPRDNGTFRCTSGHTDKSVELVILVDVKILTLSGPEFPVPENTEVTFTCEAEGGNPAPNITWEIPEISTQPEPTVSDVNSQISLTLTKDMSNKELVCRAQQGDKHFRNVTRLRITYKPTAEITITPAEYYHGDQVTLTCTTDGNPDPVITWRFDDKPIRDVPPPRNTLHIGRLKPSHTGTYTCLAVNSQGNDTASTNLTLPAKKGKKILPHHFWALVVLPMVGLVMVGLIVTVCHRESKTTNDQDVVPSNMSNENGSVTEMGIGREAKAENTNDTGAAGEMQRPQLQGHYASIWFNPEGAGTSGIRRSEQSTIYAQIDFKATARLLKNKGKGKKRKL